MPPDYPKPPYLSRKQPMPGATGKMEPRPDHGESSYKGSSKLKGLKAIITGGDSGIGRAVPSLMPAKEPTSRSPILTSMTTLRR
jgi:hypothetical protein